MKRVIDGKVYNTETATLIGEDSYGYSSDFSYWSESLYKTRNGAYFIHGEGGARSKWGRQTSQNTWSGGAGIEVLSEGEAIAWCERHQVDADVITRHFEVEDA